MAGLPEVTTTSVLDEAAQACALIAQANNQLNHYPQPSAACYSEAAANASGRSSIASTAGVGAVDLYMEDPGNPNTMGHRRWLLANSLGPIGLGTASTYSCMHVVGGSGSAGAPWVAWPPPGPVPIEVMHPRWYKLDETGWTIQSDAISLNGADVTVTRDGVPLPVQVVELAGGYGSDQALNILPDGWASEAGRSYEVEVVGASQAISYTVDFVDCL